MFKSYISLGVSEGQFAEGGQQPAEGDGY